MMRRIAGITCGIVCQIASSMISIQALDLLLREYGGLYNKNSTLGRPGLRNILVAIILGIKMVEDKSVLA